MLGIIFTFVIYVVSKRCLYNAKGGGVLVRKLDISLNEIKARQMNFNRTKVLTIIFILSIINDLQIQQAIKYMMKKFTFSNNLIVKVCHEFYNFTIILQINANKIFNNRELALGIWLFFVMILLFSSKKIRPSLLNVLKAVFCKKFVIAYIIMIIYTVVITYLMFWIGFWRNFLIKDTIMWFLFTAVITVFRAIDKGKDFVFFKKTIKDYIKITLIFEFLVNLYTFSLIGELILIPSIFLIAVCSTILEILPEYQDEKSKPTKKLFSFLQYALGFFIIVNSIALAIKDINNLGSLNNLRSLALPPIFSILFLVVPYFFALWASYEQIFIRLEFGKKKDRRLIKYIKLRVLLLCNINIKDINTFWRVHGLKLMNVRSKTDVIKVIEQIKRSKISNTVD